MCSSFPTWRHGGNCLHPTWVMRRVTEAEPLGCGATWRWMGDPRVAIFPPVWSAIPAQWMGFTASGGDPLRVVDGLEQILWSLKAEHKDESVGKLPWRLPGRC